MTLAQVPIDIICQISSVDIRDEADLNYLRSGLRAGYWLEVVCRHPAINPVLVEMKLENDLSLTVPISLAQRVKVNIYSPVRDASR